MEVSRKFPEDADLLRDVVEFSANAVQDYLEMSGDASVWDTPEQWIQSEVARRIREKRRLLVWLEPGMNKLLEWKILQSEIMASSEDERTTGFLDIVLFDPFGPIKEGDFRAIVELKSVISRGSEFNYDAKRIRFIGRHARPLCGIVAGIYIDDPSKMTQRLLKDLDVDSSAVILQTGGRDPGGSAFGAIGALVQRSSA
jgi:hypothetical protein